MELIPAVVQDYATGQVLMVAYMNDSAVRMTRETGYVHFWSRSRRRLWKKGETSGNTLRVVELRLDCDNDCLLVRAAPSGPVCHTGHATCFFSDGDGGAPASMIDDLFRTILERKRTPGEASYTRQLLDAPQGRLIGKIVEECGEFCAELPDGTNARVVAEAADLFYHLLVALGSREVDPAEVLGELAKRFGTSGLVEKAKRVAATQGGPKTRTRARKKAPPARQRGRLGKRGSRRATPRRR